MKSIKSSTRRYFKEVNYTQPLLTSFSNGIFTTFTSSEYSQRGGWKCFDDDSNYSFNYSWEPTKYVPQYIGWYNDNELYIPELTLRNSSSDNNVYWVKEGELQYWNGTAWVTEQSFTNTVSGNGQYWTITISNPIWSRMKRLYITSAGNYKKPIIANIQFNNTKERVLSTSSDYSHYEDIDIYKIPHISSKYYATE